ncbi:hypothetical protein [Lacipirellula parvula]|uniref:Uncharacterized protein n=1 Tax=Lacipirellula parvula TaxID=2650471 RepID=A0A5K7X1Y3_9BACT|nr:hypothetical protein [Lacipirellula parvula]BBO30664.1 hypothetical protein PLANPX_0276 [Lacipirellula parvula]
MADESPNAFIESLAVDGRRLRVEFLQLGDRIGHRVLAVHADGSKAVLLASQELASGEESPEAPALQSVHVQPLVDRAGELAALVGMSGANHWSFIVEPDAEAKAPRLIFDAACRIKRAGLVRMVSRYARAAEAVRAERFRFELLPLSDQSIAPRIEESDAEIAIIREITPGDVAPTTVRWRYAIELV